MVKGHAQIIYKHRTQIFWFLFKYNVLSNQRNEKETISGLILRPNVYKLHIKRIKTKGTNDDIVCA